MNNDPFGVRDASHTTPPYTNGAAPEPDYDMEQDQERIVGEFGWKEPPLRVPQSSFIMEGRGADRVGVLTNMQPLGSRPPKRMRDAAKSRLSSIKKKGYASDSARATPDLASEAGRGASARPDDLSGTDTPLSDSYFQHLPEQVSQSFPSQLQQQPEDTVMLDYPHPQTAGGEVTLHHSNPYSQVPPIDPSLFEHEEPMTPIANGPTQPIVNNNSQIYHFSAQQPAAFASVHDKIEHAIVLANNKRPGLHVMITHLHSAVLKDNELAALLAVNAEGPHNEYARRSLRKKISRVKRSVLNPDTPARSKQSKATASTPANSASAMASLPSTSQSKAPAASTPPAQEATPLAARSQPDQPPQKRIKLNIGTSPATLNPAPVGNPPAVGSPLKQVAKSPQTGTSSSPLSSVDEGIVQQANTIVPTGPRAMTGENSRKRARSPISPTDVEFEARRQKSKDLHRQVADATPRIGERSSFSISDRPIESSPPSPAPANKTGLKLNLGPSKNKPADSGSAGQFQKPAAKTKETRSTHKPAPSANTLPQTSATPTAAKQGRRGRETGTPAAAAASDGEYREGSPHGDLCTICNQKGLLVCCDTCDAAVHPACLNPPLDDHDLPEDFFCNDCQAKRRKLEEVSKYGIFNSLLTNLGNTADSERDFSLPENIRNHYEGTSTGPRGEFVEVPAGQPRAIKVSRRGVPIIPSGLDTHDRNGRLITCYWCKKTTDGQRRHLVQCDYCDNYWHMDCLPVPEANPPNTRLNQRKVWMCPLHVAHDLQKLNTMGDRPGVLEEGAPSTHKVRRARNAKVVDTTLSRGHVNNGNIEVDMGEESEEDEFLSEDEDVPRLPAKGLILDFISKVKAERDYNEHRAYRDALRRNAQLQDAQAKALAEQRRLVRAAGSEAQARADYARAQNEALARRDLATSQAALSLIALARDGATDPLATVDVNGLIRSLIDQAEPERGLGATDGAPTLNGDAAGAGFDFHRPASTPDVDAELAQLAMLERLVANRRQILLAHADKPKAVHGPDTSLSRPVAAPPVLGRGQRTSKPTRKML